MRRIDRRGGKCIFCASCPSTNASSVVSRQYASVAHRPFGSKNWVALRSKAIDLKAKGPPLGRSLRRKGNEKLLKAPAKSEDLITVIYRSLKALCKSADSDAFLFEVGLTQETAPPTLSDFEKKIRGSLDRSLRKEGTPTSSKDAQILKALQRSYIENGEIGVLAQLKFVLQADIANAGFTKSDILNQARLADLRYPYEWYPGTRSLQRRIHLHIGPTNSGKTYNALKKLEEASSGIYAGPLRLLAHEVYTRLNAKGKACNLITGDERVLVENDGHAMNSCTVEMVPINLEVEIAVIDEIQMIGHETRGWAWTQAFLGLRAREIHLCGEERAVPLVKELVAAMGDKLEIHRYERLSPLRTMSTSLEGDLKKLRKGDCVVVFSRRGIHALKKEIEKITEKRVAVVYGSLPPEIRAQQAKLFNDIDNDYDILVASDAIGMGLNLSIKRIIFESTSRFNGSEVQVLATSDIKQIAGRAGRYRTAADDQKQIEGISLSQRPTRSLGLITTLDKMDLPVVHRAMTTDAAPILSAGIFPPDSVLIRFSTYFPPNTPLSYILLRLHEISRTNRRFHLCDLKDHVGIADVIEQVRGLTVEDRLTFCAAPVPLGDGRGPQICLAYARCVAGQGGGALLDIRELHLEILDENFTAETWYLKELESLHKALILYIWLSYRFTGVFTSQSLAFYVKGLVEKRIDEVLATVTANPNARKAMKRLREKIILQSFKNDMEIHTSAKLVEISSESSSGGQSQDFQMADLTVGLVSQDSVDRGDTLQPSSFIERREHELCSTGAGISVPAEA